MARSETLTARIPTLSQSRTATASTLFNPFDPAVSANPYPHYARLRATDPVHWSKLGMWFVGRYEDARTVLKDRRLSVRDVRGVLRSRDAIIESGGATGCPAHGIGRFVENAGSWLAFKEGSDHKRLRNVYARLLHRNFAESLRPVVRDSVRALIECRRRRGGMDLMADLARKLALEIIARMLGAPEEELPQIQAWARALTRFIVSFTSLDELKALDGVCARFEDYLRRLLREREGTASQDLISKMLRENPTQGEPLTEQELLSVCTFIVVAGMEAVENLIGNGSVALLTHPQEAALLRETPDLIDSAVEELTRYDSPLQMIMRIAQEDVEVGGKLIRAGDHVYIALGSANRDPEQFESPDSLVLGRQQNRHLAFGDGHHLCVGAQLARMEGQEAFREIAQMLPEVELTGDRLDWGRSLLSRGVVRLPVRFV